MSSKHEIRSCLWLIRADLIGESIMRVACKMNQEAHFTSDDEWTMASHLHGPDDDKSLEPN